MPDENTFQVEARQLQQAESAGLLMIKKALFLPIWGTLFTAAIWIAAPAHASQDSDFLGCLANHRVTYKDQNATVQLFHQAQARFPSELTPYPLMNAYFIEQGLDVPTARSVAECEMAATLMEGH